jgi:hypothetical protein
LAQQFGPPPVGAAPSGDQSKPDEQSANRRTDKSVANETVSPTLPTSGLVTRQDPEFEEPRWTIPGDTLSGLQSMARLLEANANSSRDSQLTYGSQVVNEATLKILLFEAMLFTCREKYRHLDQVRGKTNVATSGSR